jgi:hypothetical protein
MEALRDLAARMLYLALALLLLYPLPWLTRIFADILTPIVTAALNTLQ